MGNSGGTISQTPSLSHSLAVDIANIDVALPNHLHTVPGHSHGFSLATAANNTTSAGAHAHSITDPGHNHTYRSSFRQGSGTRIADSGSTSSNGNDSQEIFNNTTGITINSGGAHTHPIPALAVAGTVGSGASGDAAFNSGNPTTNPNISVNPPSTAITGTTTSSAIDITNPYQVVNYIIKATNTAAPSIVAVNIPTGTAGQTFYNNGAGWLATSNVTNNGTNVGIGTTSPSALFSVGTGSAFQINNSGAIAAATGITSSGAITFSGLNTNGLVRTTGTNGVLSIGQAATADIADNAITNVKVNDVAWGKITGVPTTLAGYGITNAVQLSPASQQIGNINVSGSATLGGGLTAAGIVSSGATTSNQFSGYGSGDTWFPFTDGNNYISGSATVIRNNVANSYANFATFNATGLTLGASRKLVFADASSMSKAPRTVAFTDTRAGCPPLAAANTDLFGGTIILTSASTVSIQASTIRSFSGRSDFSLIINGVEVHRSIASTSVLEWQTANVQWSGTLAAGSHTIFVRGSTANSWGCTAVYGRIDVMINEQ